MICPQCKKEIPETPNIMKCPSCGAPLTQNKESQKKTKNLLLIIMIIGIVGIVASVVLVFFDATRTWALYGIIGSILLLIAMTFALRIVGASAQIKQAVKDKTSNSEKIEK